ncbi:MAG: HPr family phosphocarrier protein [Lachnospiraceae bacterium]|nr:HPr family phosphocarrier protein [Lachnospiraceae bacterium]
MSVKKIKLKQFEDVKDFVRAAEKCDYDVDISYNRIVIDAKSLMGVLSLDLTKELTVRYHEEDMHFTNILEKYAVS